MNKNNCKSLPRSRTLGAFALLLFSPGILAETLPSDLTTLSIEDLMKVNVLDTPVMSVSKKSQRLADAPAAITVITQDDIHRSGLQTLPDLLRLAPGMSVGRYNGSDWTVSSRGFGEVLSNKLLILQDGRTLYNHGFGGVFWALEDAVIADLDRIEVVRGPGATLWGSNAVNGVINIVSKDASQTQGVLLDTHVGTELLSQSVRYGFKLDDQTYARVYGKYRLLDDSIYSSSAGELAGQDANDSLHDGRFGFRIDRMNEGETAWTLDGELMSSQADETTLKSDFYPPWNIPVDNVSNMDSSHIRSKWIGKTDDSDFAIQAYFNHIQIRNNAWLKYYENTFDLEYEHTWRMKDHELTWGAGYRAIFDSGNILDPEDRTSHLFNVFVQDCWTLVPKTLNLYVGSKLELSSYADPAIQPSARLSWTPDARLTVWASVSRAIRTPSRGEMDARWRYSTEIDPYTSNPFVVNVVGNPALHSEELYAYEMGYRLQPADDLVINLAGFFNAYRHLTDSGVAGMELVYNPYPHAEVNTTMNNGISGKTWGLELQADWKVTRNWKIGGSYSWIDGDFDAMASMPGLLTTGSEYYENRLIHNLLQVHSAWDVSRDLSFNASMYYQDALSLGNVPPYLRLDLNLSWRPGKNAEIIVGASSLLDDSYPEWLESSNRNLGTEMQRAFYIQTIFRF